MRIEQIIGLGFIIILIGFVIIFIGILQGAKETNSKTKVAIGGFIGPIPFGFGNDKNLVWFITLVSIVLFLIWIFAVFKIRNG